MKKFFLFILFIPTFAMSKGIHNNQIKLQIGGIFGDTAFDEYSTDFYGTFKIKGVLFVEDDLYFIADVENDWAEYKDQNNSIDLYIDSLLFRIGIGGEFNIDSNFSVFSETMFGSGIGDIDISFPQQAGKITYEFDILNIVIILGMRGIAEQLLWEVALDYNTTRINYEDNIFQSEVDSGFSIHGNLGYKLSENFSIGTNLNTDFSLYRATGSIAYHF